MQPGVLRPVAGDPPGRFGGVGEPGLDLRLAGRVELAVDQRVQLAVGDPPVAHLILRRPGAGPESMRKRSSSRARDRRDITVPTGTSRMAAASPQVTIRRATWRE